MYSCVTHEAFLYEINVLPVCMVHIKSGKKEAQGKVYAFSLLRTANKAWWYAGTRDAEVLAYVMTFPASGIVFEESWT